MPVPIVVEWRRPGFYKKTYLVRRHKLAELLASLGMVAGRDFPEYVPPAQDRAQRRATGAGAEEEPAELQARAPLLDDGAECAGEEEEQPEGHGGQETEGHGGQEPEGQATTPQALCNRWSQPTTAVEPATPVTPPLPQAQPTTPPTLVEAAASRASKHSTPAVYRTAVASALSADSAAPPAPTPAVPVRLFGPKATPPASGSGPAASHRPYGFPACTNNEKIVRGNCIQCKAQGVEVLQIKNKAHCGFCWGAFQEAATANAVPRSGAVKPQPASARLCSPQPASARLCSPPPGFARLRSPQPRLCSPPPEFARPPGSVGDDPRPPTQKGKQRSWMMAPNALGVKEAQPEGHGGQEPAPKMCRI